MAEINGDDNDNILEGTSGFDVISGKGGNDTLYGFAGVDELNGDEGSDTLYGGDGFDNLNGGSGNDMLFGEADSDELAGGDGDDLLDGGEGFDRANFSDATQGVTIDLNAGTATGQGSDTLVSIEGAAGSAYDDIFIGNDGDNEFYGQGGDDLVSVTLGSDYFSGGFGTDTIDFSNVGQGLSIYWQSVNAPGLTVNFSGFEQVIGTSFNDTIIGFITSWGGTGDDWIYLDQGGSAFGEGGNDVLVMSYLDDHLDGGDGLDFVYTGQGFFTYEDGGLVRGVTIDLNVSEQSNLGADGNQVDTFVSIEGVGGTAFADTLTGDGNANMLWGWSERGTGENHDTIRGQAGDDWIIVGEGNHNLAGNGGQDVLEFFGSGLDTNAGTGFTFSLALQGAAQNTGVGMMTAFGFEHLSGGEFDDHLTGDAGDNQISGSEGSDQLFGGDGNDILRGDATTHMDESGWYLSLDGVDDTGNNHDSLYGGNGDDMLYGEYGDDLLVGGEGLDFLDGGDGDDTLRGGGQKDELEGGTARDKLYGGAGSDTAHGGDANDVVRGNGGDDNLFGDAGDDRILGGGGQDKLVGGEGNDELIGGNGDDTFFFGLDSGTDLITDFTDGDTIEFAAGLGLTFEDLLIVEGESSTTISWGTGDSIEVMGSDATGLDASDFAFGQDAMAATLAQIDAGVGA